MSEFVLQTGQVIGGRFRVIRPLAKGGMSIVYLVQHQQLQSQHALKLMELRTAEVRSRMMQEGQVQSNLSHSNIVSVTDSFECEGRLALVMEYVEGHSLYTFLSAHEKMSLSQVEQVMRGLIQGLGYAHSHGLIHRDLKPANVLLQERSGLLIPKITDFGIVKVLDSFKNASSGHHTKTGTSMGTPAYTAPEQAEDPRAVTQASDIFSLGCILYEMVCGKPAFSARSSFGVQAKAAEAMFDDPRTVAPGWPERFYTAIERSLTPDPKERILNIDAFDNALFGGGTSSKNVQSMAPTLILEPKNVVLSEAEPMEPAEPEERSTRLKIGSIALFILLVGGLVVLLITLLSAFGCLAFLRGVV